MRIVVVGVIGLVISLALARQTRPVITRDEYPPPHTRDPRL